MQKIPTVFERGPTHGVIDERRVPENLLADAIPTEKIDGMNVRITVRQGEAVRIEGRRNPSKGEKAQGIIEPWYRDSWDLKLGDFPYSPSDAYLLDAVRNTKLTDLADGEYAGEAYGPKIQGNHLDVTKREVHLFSRPERWLDVWPNGKPPTDYAGLKEWLRSARSHLNRGRQVEGIVWWATTAEDAFPVGKIKVADFV